MHASEKSDIGIVPKKGPNKIRKLMAEALEGRPVANGKTVEDDCDLYVETGGNIEWTRQDTRSSKPHVITKGRSPVQ